MVSNHLPAQLSNKYPKFACPKSKSCLILHSFPKNLLSHTSPQLSKWTVCTAKILRSHKLYPIHQQILSTLPPQWPKPPWSLIKITATASCSGHFRAPCHVLLAYQTSAQPWWTAPSTLPAFPPQAALSLFIFCSTTSAGSLQQPWSAEKEILPLRATFNQLG